MKRLVEAVKPILGPDLMVWSSGLFIEANTPHVVSWHQDLTYWGLSEVDEITAWVALSPSNLDSGCMRFVPGSHKRQLVDHRDTFDPNNLLTRGQEIAVDIDDADGVDVILETGQASLHHGHLFHSSGPNTTGDRRIGSAIRYQAFDEAAHGRQDLGDAGQWRRRVWPFHCRWIAQGMAS